MSPLWGMLTGKGELNPGGIKVAKIKNLDAWLKAKKQYRLSSQSIQMARELGMNPKKLGKLANHKQEPWKAPLPVFIQECYFKRFGKERPGSKQN